jgi:hypothetical protein
MKRRSTYLLSVCATVAMLDSCGAPHGQLATPSTMSQSSRQANGNIYWSRNRLRLPYPSRSHGRAILTYFGPDGYFTYPVFCKRGGSVSATPHRTFGNPSSYLHVVYWFKAQTPGPDDCAYTAVLNNTGSPPIAIVKLHIEGK